MIYFMASGASEKMAYSHAAFLFTEMQWIDAAAYNTGEYFHGPFEAVSYTHLDVYKRQTQD